MMDFCMDLISGMFGGAVATYFFYLFITQDSDFKHASSQNLGSEQI